MSIDPTAAGVSTPVAAPYLLDQSDTSQAAQAAIVSEPACSFIHLVRELELVDLRLELGHARLEGVTSVEDRGSGRVDGGGHGDERGDEKAIEHG